MQQYTELVLVISFGVLCFYIGNKIIHFYFHKEVYTFLCSTVLAVTSQEFRRRWVRWNRIKEVIFLCNKWLQNFGNICTFLEYIAPSNFINSFKCWWNKYGGYIYILPVFLNKFFSYISLSYFPNTVMQLSCYSYMLLNDNTQYVHEYFMSSICMKEVISVISCYLFHFNLLDFGRTNFTLFTINEIY